MTMEDAFDQRLKAAFAQAAEPLERDAEADAFVEKVKHKLENPDRKRVLMLGGAGSTGSAIAGSQLESVFSNVSLPSEGAVASLAFLATPEALAAAAKTSADEAGAAAAQAQASADAAMSRANQALNMSDLDCMTNTINQSAVGSCPTGYTVMGCSQTRYTHAAGGLSFLREVNNDQCRFNSKVLEMDVRCCRRADAGASQQSSMPDNS